MSFKGGLGLVLGVGVVGGRVLVGVGVFIGLIVVEWWGLVMGWILFLE